MQSIHSIFQCPLCRTIPTEQRAAFLADINYIVKHFDKKETIIQQHTPYNYLYILINGEVETQMIDENGDYTIVETIQAPNPLATGFLFASCNQSPVTAIALTSCVIISIHKENILTLMHTYPEFLTNFLAQLSDKMAFMSERLRLASYKSIKSKLAFYLLKTSNGENQFTLPASKEDVSKHLSVTRPAMVNILRQFVDEGIIEFDKREISIINRRALQQLI